MVVLRVVHIWVPGAFCQAGDMAESRFRGQSDCSGAAPFQVDRELPPGWGVRPPCNLKKRPPGEPRTVPDSGQVAQSAAPSTVGI